MGMAAGPAAPMMTDQKSAGFSRAAQRQYLRGVDQNRGAAVMVGGFLGRREESIGQLEKDGRRVGKGGHGAAHSIGGRRCRELMFVVLTVLEPGRHSTHCTRPIAGAEKPSRGCRIILGLGRCQEVKG